MASGPPERHAKLGFDPRDTTRYAPGVNLRSIHAAALALTLVSLAAGAADPTPNTLTQDERAAGWRLLFDGQTSEGWRGFKKPSFPDKGWVVENGTLRHVGKTGGGDLVTTEKFSDYEFVFEWSINEGGNGGVKYFITEDRATAIGHEYQIMGEKDLAEINKDRHHATGSFYAVIPTSAELPLRPAGTWNQSRITIRGSAVEHWMNGVKVVSYELGSDVVKAGIAASKFKTVPGFGTKFPHHILLQDHGGDIRFRNLKIHPLPPK